MLADQALEKVCNLQKSGTVLDIGCGSGDHSREFLKRGYTVTGIDIVDPQISDEKFTHVYGLFNELVGGKEKDIVWCSHTLEHITNVGGFLGDIRKKVKVGGYVAITVPPLKHEIVGGHVNLFNAGILIYRMVLAGFNMKNCMVKQYGYNISVIVKYDPITLPELNYDIGDIEILSQYFPDGYNFQGFDGNIQELNWG